MHIYFSFQWMNWSTNTHTHTHPSGSEAKANADDNWLRWPLESVMPTTWGPAVSPSILPWPHPTPPQVLSEPRSRKIRASGSTPGASGRWALAGGSALSSSCPLSLVTTGRSQLLSGAHGSFPLPYKKGSFLESNLTICTKSLRSFWFGNSTPRNLSYGNN